MHPNNYINKLRPHKIINIDQSFVEIGHPQQNYYPSNKRLRFMNSARTYDRTA